MRLGCNKGEDFPDELGLGSHTRRNGTMLPSVWSASLMNLVCFPDEFVLEMVWLRPPRPRRSLSTSPSLGYPFSHIEVLVPHFAGRPRTNTGRTPHSGAGIGRKVSAHPAYLLSGVASYIPPLLLGVIGI